jgi:hypothetical protein
MQWTAGILREAYRNWFVAGYLFRSLAAFEENLIRVLTNICRKTVKGNKTGSIGGTKYRVVSI